MGIRGFAEYLDAKYAGQADYESGQADMSFGLPISAEKTRILKDKLILTYDKVHQGITQLPMYQMLNEELKGEHYWEVFHSLVENLAANVEFMPLKDAFEFSKKLSAALDQLRDSFSRMKMERSKMLKMDEAI